MTARDTDTDAVADAVGRASVATLGGGHPLDRAHRRRLETLLAADLGDVRIHRGPHSNAAADRLHADAYTVGDDIHFAADTYHPDTAAGFALLAHEVLHTRQHRPGPRVDDRPWAIASVDDPHERAARIFADQTSRGAGCVHRPEVTASRSRRMIYRHDSFEHRALGDVATADIAVISGGGATRTELVEREIALQQLWQQDPESVTEEQLTRLCPQLRSLRLQESGLLVTYGELNALPDYIATGQVADTVSKAVLLPILQFIRQESFNRFNGLLGRTTTTAFHGAVYSPSAWKPGQLDRLLESVAIDELTVNLGVNGVDHYTALLGRNACHFAPFSWHRWQAAYLAALDLARRAHAQSDPNERARLTHAAWVQHGYGDHFLQDSFAAGHLVNKTLIMQWFVEWAANQALVPVFAWDTVRKMTTVAQPALAGRRLYDPTFAGPGNDPQTAEDQATYDDRLRATALSLGASSTLDDAYQDYLIFLSSLVTQSSSAAIHDYYNANSLWVASTAHPEPYEVWGDDTLFSGANGGDGAVATSAAAQMSQQAILDILATGDTAVTTAELRDQFPTQVRGSGGQLLSLEAWNDSQRQFCADKIFPDLHDIVINLASPQITNISRDQDLTTRWSTSLSGAGYTTTSVLLVGDHLFVGSNGYLYDLDPTTGDVRSLLRLTDPVGVGNYETRLASDGRSLFAGVHGYTYAVPIGGALRVAWTANMSGSGYNAVDVLTSAGALFAGSNGYLYRLDPGTGRVLGTVKLSSLFGTGDYTMRLAVTGSTLVVGCHGYVYARRTSDLGATWECSLPNAGYNPVEVITQGDQIYAGSNGYVFHVEGSAAPRQSLRVDSLGGTTTLVAGDQKLFVGCRGYVYAVTLTDWSRTAWTANLPGNRYTSINLAATGDQLLAGSYGYVFRIAASGRVERVTLLAAPTGIGNYETRLAFGPDGNTVYAGTHGYAYALSS